MWHCDTHVSKDNLYCHNYHGPLKHQLELSYFKSQITALLLYTLCTCLVQFKWMALAGECAAGQGTWGAEYWGVDGLDMIVMGGDIDILETRWAQQLVITTMGWWDAATPRPESGKQGGRGGGGQVSDKDGNKMRSLKMFLYKYKFTICRHSYPIGDQSFHNWRVFL